MIGVRVVLVSALAGALGCGSVSAGGDAGPDAPAAGGASGTAGPAGASGAGTAGAATGGAGATGLSGDSGTAGAATAGATGTAGAGGGAAPGPFTLKAPLSGDPTVTTAPTLTWTAAAGAASYTVEIATASTFGAADVTRKTGLTTTTFAPVDALQPGVIYYWRVTALGGGGGGGSTSATNAPFAMATPATAGPSPHGVAVTPDGKRAVVTNDKPGGSVTLLDLAAFTTQSITLPGQPGLVAITPDGAHALIAEGSPNNVAVVDLAQGAVAGTITPPCVGTTLYGIAIKVDGSAALLPDLSGGCTKDVLDVIPLPGTTLSQTLDLSPASSAFGVAVTPDGAAALVTRGILTTSILRVALPGGGLTTIANTSSSFGVAVTPDGKEALVSSGESDTIKRISLATNAVTGAITFDTNQDVGNLAIAPSGKIAVAVGDFKVGVINLADGSVMATFSLAGRSVAITPDSKRGLVTGAGSTGKLYVLALP